MCTVTIKQCTSKVEGQDVLQVAVTDGPQHHLVEAVPLLGLTLLGGSGAVPLLLLGSRRGDGLLHLLVRLMLVVLDGDRRGL